MPELTAGDRVAGRFGAAQLVAVELAAVAAAGATVAAQPVAIGLAGAAAVVAGGALVRSGGRWGYEAASARLRHQRRQLFGTGGLSLLAGDLGYTTITDRGTTIGAGHDTKGWYAAVSVGVPTGHSVIRLDWLARLLADFTVPVSAIQLVVRQAPLTIPPDQRSDAALSYRELTGAQPATLNREMWLAVRLGPGDAARATAERGGGITGVHRALATAIARISTGLRAINLPHAILDADMLQQAVAISCGLSGPEVKERWTGWQAGGLEHVGFAVASWPRQLPARLLTTMATVPLATVVHTALVLRPRLSGPPALRTLVRIGAAADRIAVASSQVREGAQRLGVKLIRLNGEHASAVYATAPTGAVHGVALW